MAFEARKIPVFIRFAAFSTISAALLVFSFSDVQAQYSESDQPYTPSGRMFDANKDSSKVVDGTRSEFESRADVYEAENFRRRLEAQTRQEYLRRFNIHDFIRPTGPYDDN
tara:strand:- start:158 stop:490 length:333 start_codon:yes stop_codon:yes gene_type:complete